MNAFRSILTGLYPATSGRVTIDDLDVRTHVKQIRKTLGFCPQHNVLFSKLSVEEQLTFYAQLKGVPSSRVEEEISRYLRDVNLIDKRKTVASKLSGGQQRKLSIAIAFIGSTKTVILDEPTAGVDPFARRAIWELLLKYKKVNKFCLLHLSTNPSTMGALVDFDSGIGKLMNSGGYSQQNAYRTAPSYCQRTSWTRRMCSAIVLPSLSTAACVVAAHRSSCANVSAVVIA